MRMRPTQRKLITRSVPETTQTYSLTVLEAASKKWASWGKNPGVGWTGSSGALGENYFLPFPASSDRDAGIRAWMFSRAVILLTTGRGRQSQGTARTWLQLCLKPPPCQSRKTVKFSCAFVSVMSQAFFPLILKGL